jgi:hypothetical protein
MPPQSWPARVEPTRCFGLPPSPMSRGEIGELLKAGDLAGSRPASPVRPAVGLMTRPMVAQNTLYATVI